MQKHRSVFFYLLCRPTHIRGSERVLSLIHLRGGSLERMASLRALMCDLFARRLATIFYIDHFDVPNSDHGLVARRL